MTLKNDRQYDQFGHAAFEAARAAQAVSEALILTARISVIFSEIFSEICSAAAGEADDGNGPMRGANSEKVYESHLRKRFSDVKKNWILF